MKTSDMKVNAEYAVTTSNYQWANPGRRSAYRAVVLETGVKREFYRPNYMRPSVKNDGILVRFVETGKEQVVTAKDVRQDWQSYVTEEQDIAKSLKESAARRLDLYSDAAERINAVLPEGTRMPYGFDMTVFADGSYSKGGKVSTPEMATLLEAAFAAGVASVKA